MILGVLGGMGPLAGAQFCARLTLLTPAARDQDHIPFLLWSDPSVPDRTAARLGTGPDPLPALLRGLRGLEAAGARAIVIPCNTAHGWFDAMQAACPLPILHIVDAAAVDLARQGVRPGRIGLLATEGTLAMRLYQERLQAAGWEVLVPPPGVMTGCVTPAIEAVKAGRPEASTARLAEAAAGLVAAGATAVVLGCTEIPLGLPEGAARAAVGVPVVDTIDALARAAIGWARPAV
ncbi:aspartate racemase [Humitalea rosea]|uniref:Aspartate racemase n=1 Tax=Humitalea rosea TaxID=990373 RepID=A0A2W7KRD2_9PROT|nr:amino acid racemase [Humitalea rosea]PZW51140.1 aspartate racemase [Humitalea rosea]